MNKKKIGSTFNSWLREEGFYGEVRAAAVQRVIARQIDVAAKESGLAKPELPKTLRPVVRTGR
jgi:antitoxin HicB